MKGASVLVTGGTRGIGRAVVDAFAKQGARVAFTYRSSSSAAEALQAQLESEGAEVLQYQADGSKAEASAAVVKGVVGAWGRLDVLVNNAGIARDNLLLRVPEADWDMVMDTNLKSMYHYCKAAYRPMMRQRAGRIINLSSIVGVVGNPGQTVYAATKAGVIGFTKSLAKELARRGVTVNAVAPGYVATDMTEALTDKGREAMMSGIPMGRAATPAEIAAAVTFLASEGAGYITGHVLQVDGGLAM